MNWLPPSILTLLIAVTYWAYLHDAGVADENSPASAARRAMQLSRMKEIASSIEIYPTIQRQEMAKLLTDPVLRYSDDTRELHESSLWVSGIEGRPCAIIAIEFYTKGPAGPRWLCEIASLSTERIAIQRASELNWTATGPGLKLQSIAGDAPADKPARRLAQMKDLLRRFAAHERAPVGGRIELRLLTSPLHRYQDSTRGVIDGAVFSFANGTNPEVWVCWRHRKWQTVRPHGNTDWPK